MRISCLALVLIAGMGLTSCTRDHTARGTHPNARQAGREAYRASQAAKRDMKEAERDLRNAGREFREGWNEAKHDDTTRRKK